MSANLANWTHGSRPLRAARRRASVGVAPATTTATTALAALAARIRVWYEEARSAYESLLTGARVRYRAPRRYAGVAARCMEEDESVVLERAVPPVWDKLAAFFLARKIDAALYIRVQFEPAQLKLRAAPEPHQLITEARLAAYEERKQKLGPALATALASQKEIAAMEIAAVEGDGRSSEDACAATLVNTSVELSPLFRYCLARSMPGERFRAIAKLYVYAAVRQFMCYREHYCAHWRAWLPSGFPAMAEALYERALLAAAPGA